MQAVTFIRKLKLLIDDLALEEISALLGRLFATENNLLDPQQKATFSKLILQGHTALQILAEDADITLIANAFGLDAIYAPESVTFYISSFQARSNAAEITTQFGLS